MKRIVVVLVFVLSFLLVVVAQAAVDYDIVYVRSPRLGDDTHIALPEVKDPINIPPGTDLMLLHPDGTEEVLISGGNGAAVDPYISFDGKWVYYAKFHDQRPETLNRHRHNASRAGADIFKINLDTRKIVRLTFQEWTPNTGVVNWSDDHLRKSATGDYYLGYGIFNLGPTPLPGGKIMFTSSRNGFLPNKSYTFPNLQLFVMDEDGKNVELIGHLNLGSALHPTILSDGRVMFASYESQGLRDKRVWGLWAIWPDGRQWAPLMSAFQAPSALHFQTELANNDLAVVAYYNKTNNGFGTLLAFPPRSPEGVPGFGDPVPSHPSNPKVKREISRAKQYSLSPYGLYSLTEFSHEKDRASVKDAHGAYVGKVTHPSGAPNNDVLLVWSPGPANDQKRPVNLPTYDAGLYLLRGGKPVDHPDQLALIKNDPNFNEMQPHAVVPYRKIYGMDAPAALPWLPNDGSEHAELPAGTPFGLIGTSSFYKRNTSPGVGQKSFDGLDSFNWFKSSNWSSQGADAGRYTNSDIYAVRIVAMEPTSHISYGPGGGAQMRGFLNYASERLRILGEIPLRKVDAQGNPILDIDGAPDTSFLAKIPADTPFTFQTLDKDGLVLNMSQTWHQVRPGEVRTDCGGCHGHAQLPTDFATTEAAKPGYSIRNLALGTPLLSKDKAGNPIIVDRTERAIDVEYYRDIKPILQRSCVGCHAGADAAAGLVLDDETLVKGLENTYHRLAHDPKAQYGIPPVYGRTWRGHNASRYLRKFQSRRSLLIWKVFGRRLDGWTNDDHPTETIPGNVSTLPDGANVKGADIDFTGTIMPPPNSGYPALSEDEKIMFARWIDLGSPISPQEGLRAQLGWFADDLRPTLTMSLPRAAHQIEPLHTIRIGAFDYYSALDKGSLSVKANFSINGSSPGTELVGNFTETGDHIWTMAITSPINDLANGLLTVSVKDMSGNITQVERSFSVGNPDSIAPESPSNLSVLILKKN